MALEQESNRQLIQQRLNLFRIPVLLIFLLLGARLWQLQIIQGSEYALKAERNRVRSIALTAPRGNILDRNGVPLVDNRPSFDVLTGASGTVSGSTPRSFRGRGSSGGSCWCRPIRPRSS